MNKAKITPIDVLRGRLAQLYKEKEELVIDLEMEKKRDEESGRDVHPIDYEDAYGFFHTEIYKYEFCIDEIERIIKMIES